MNDRRRNTVRIDYDKLAEAIVKAELKVNDEIEVNKEAEQEKLQKEWQTNLGIDKEKSAFCNELKALKSIVLMKKEKAITRSANNTMLKTVIIMIYLLFEISIYLLTLFSIVLAVKFYKVIYIDCFAVFMLILGTLFARIIRLARFEVEKISDQNYLATLFSAVIAFVSIIISIVAIVISIIYKG